MERCALGIIKYITGNHFVGAHCVRPLKSQHKLLQAGERSSPLQVKSILSVRICCPRAAQPFHGSNAHGNFAENGNSGVNGAFAQNGEFSGRVY